jgi:hypothetical protein
MFKPRSRLKSFSLPRQMFCCRLIDTSENFHQCRFASSVLAEDGVNLTGLHSKVDILDRGNAAKVFGCLP